METCSKPAAGRLRCGSHRRRWWTEMGKYLDLLRAADRDQSDQSDQRSVTVHPALPFGRFGRLCRTFQEIEQRRPDYVTTERWHQCIEDGRRFLASWAQQAERLGWTADDLFGLHQPSANPHPNYSRLSRRDHMGLVWVLMGQPVVALTDRAAIIKTVSGTLTWRRC